jgi:hypothetical protein
MQPHSTPFVGITAKVAATCLVLASAGFGAVFAYSTGIQHGIVLAGLTVLFAVALELVKPLAIHAAFQALGSLAILRGLSLALLGLVAVAYSLTAELALVSGSRGDLASQRASEAFQANAAQDRYQRAKLELASLKPSRPVQELQAMRDGWKRAYPSQAWVLEPELARAKKRVELEGVLQTSTTGTATKVADPGSTALATYLSALGLVVSVEIIAQWLNLVPVLALELGSALAMVLVTSLAPARLPEAPVSQPVSQALIPVNTAVAPYATQVTPSERDRVANQILSHLRQHGSISSSHRGLAKRFGADRNTVARALTSLASCGYLAMQATKKGTALQLLA